MTEAKDRVEIFIEMYLNMKMSVQRFMQYLTNPRPTELDLIDITKNLKELPESLKYSRQIAEGSSGNIYQIDNQNQILKFIKIDNDHDEFDKLLLQRNIIKEVLIHFILSSDADTQPFVPIFYELYRKTINGEQNIVIHMEMGNISILKALRNNIIASDDKTLNWGLLSLFLRSIIMILSKLFEKYKYSHRDLHLSNIMVFDRQIKLIDFGYSALTIKIEGVPHKIIHDGLYAYHIECNPKQDLGLLLTNIYEKFYKKYLDENGKKFLELIFTGREGLSINVAKYNESTLAGKIYKRYKNLKLEEEGAPIFHATYNTSGNLYSNTCPTTSRFTIQYINKLIDYIDNPANNPLPLVTNDPLAPARRHPLIRAGGASRKSVKKSRRRRRFTKHK